MNLRDMLNMVRGGQDDRICVIKGTVSINDEGINKILYDGKYWIRVKGTGEIIPPIPEELMNAEAGMGLGTEADYLILAPDFDVDAYWNTVKTNPPYFRRKTYDRGTFIVKDFCLYAQLFNYDNGARLIA